MHYLVLRRRTWSEPVASTSAFGTGCDCVARTLSLPEGPVQAATTDAVVALSSVSRPSLFAHHADSTRLELVVTSLEPPSMSTGWTNSSPMSMSMSMSMNRRRRIGFRWRCVRD
ncbi:hypothetical protein L227DRAFT_300301 [Lentinus tigrinus ALCF2SS1-6]|uniref:Uncharacterized protein n=1 Tax=Lentinus tigrinus ALCF2SS1-6 TaxID=1328759 RepID=A0A5C2RXF2_9APHY|nr:hypothetical protein L227DRAFT_300301 [Lentinus tigrinus ALCF2SS1-6]